MPPWTPLSSPPRAQRPTMLYILHGDATDLRSFEPDRPKLLAHVCNDQGLWGAGFSGALSARWKEPEIQYRHCTPQIGDVQFVAVEGRTVVANMVAQHGVRRFDGDNPQRVYVNKQMRLDRSIGVPAFAAVPGVRPPLRYCGPGPLHGAGWASCLEPRLRHSLPAVWERAGRRGLEHHPVADPGAVGGQAPQLLTLTSTKRDTDRALPSRPRCTAPQGKEEKSGGLPDQVVEKPAFRKDFQCPVNVQCASSNKACVRKPA